MKDYEKFIKKYPDKLARGIAIVIYSDPGIGKTTLGGTLPVNDTLIVNTEAGEGPLYGSGHIGFDVRAAIANGMDLETAMTTIYREVRTGVLKVKNVVLDNVSELLDQLRLHYTEKHGKSLPELREYGDASFKLLAWIHEWRDLREIGINVVFNAWEYPYEIQQGDGISVTKTGPLVGATSCKKVCGLVDIVARLEKVDKSDVRWLRISPSRQYITKCQFKGLDERGEVADLPTIFAKIKAYDYAKPKEGVKNAEVTSTNNKGTSTSGNVQSKDK